MRIDRARALAALERWPEAEADLNRALSLDPERAAGYLFRATARRMQDKLPIWRWRIYSLRWRWNPKTRRRCWSAALSTG